MEDIEGVREEKVRRGVRVVGQDFINGDITQELHVR